MALCDCESLIVDMNRKRKILRIEYKVGFPVGMLLRSKADRHELCDRSTGKKSIHAWYEKKRLSAKQEKGSEKKQ
jgi:hypothetical protein